MSEEAIEIVRRLVDPYEGQDMIPRLRELVEKMGPAPTPGEVLAVWAEDPAWRHAHPEMEWDATASGFFGSTLHGPVELAGWWADWTEAWQSYSYRTLEYRDLGEWVLTPTDVTASGPAGMPLEMRVFQIWSVRDGKVSACRVFLSEAEAVEAASASR